VVVLAELVADVSTWQITGFLVLAILVIALAASAAWEKPE